MTVNPDLPVPPMKTTSTSGAAGCGTGAIESARRAQLSLP